MINYIEVYTISQEAELIKKNIVSAFSIPFSCVLRLHLTLTDVLPFYLLCFRRILCVRFPFTFVLNQIVVLCVLLADDVVLSHRRRHHVVRVICRNQMKGKMKALLLSRVSASERSEKEAEYHWMFPVFIHSAVRRFHNDILSNDCSSDCRTSRDALIKSSLHTLSTFIAQ